MDAGGPMRMPGLISENPTIPLEILFEHMPMGIAVIDRDFRLVRCNPTWATFIDRYTLSTADKVVPGTDIFELEPGTQETLVPLFKRVWAGETVRLDAVRLESGGLESFWDIVLSPIYENQKVIGLLDVSIDATKRVKAERQLQETIGRLAESESLLRSVVENAQQFAIYRVQVDHDNPYHGKVVLVSPSMGELSGIDDPYDFSQWFENLHPEDLPRVMEANRCALENGSVYNQQARIFNKRENRWRWVQTISNPGFDVEGRLTHFDGMVIDLTEQKEAEKALKEINATLEQRVAERTAEIDHRRTVAESLRDFLSILNTERPLDEILEHIVTQAQSLLGCKAVAIHKLNPEDGLLSPQAFTGLTPEYTANIRLRVGQGALGRAVLTCQPVVVNDTSVAFLGKQAIAAEGESIALNSNLSSKLQQFPESYGAVLAVPLIVRSQVYGGLVLYYELPRTIQAEEVQLAATYAGQASLAIENAQLQAQAEETAILAERSRLARELHDAVTQTLFSTSLIAEVLPRLWQRNPEEAAKRLEELRALTRGALAEMRTLLLELRPTALKDAELNELMRHLADAFTGRARLPVQLRVEGIPGALPSDVKVALYRIAQEALNNIVKHAQANQVDLSLEWLAEGIKLTIADNGCGFDPQSVPTQHLGIGIMRERAAHVKADFHIDSKTGKGTRIRVVWQPGASR